MKCKKLNGRNKKMFALSVQGVRKKEIYLQKSIRGC